MLPFCLQIFCIITYKTYSYIEDVLNDCVHCSLSYHYIYLLINIIKQEPSIKRENVLIMIMFIAHIFKQNPFTFCLLHRFLRNSAQLFIETPIEDEILWIVLSSKLTMFDLRSKQFGVVYGSLPLFCFKCNCHSYLY